MQEILAFCSDQKLKNVLNIGRGTVAASLRSAGLRVLDCDFDPAGPHCIHFDPSGCAEGAAQVFAAMKEQTGGEPWLVICLDVLAHIASDDVFAAVRNLRAVCDGHLIASLSTRPCSLEGKLHATILPKATWLEIFRTVGFAVEDDRALASARAVCQKRPKDEELGLASYWAKCDLFGDIGNGEPDFVRLSADHGAGLSEGPARQRVEALMDVLYRREKRAQFNAGLGALKDQASRLPRIGFNLHHMQEFILYRPLLDVLSRSSVAVLIRTSVLDPDALLLAREFFARRGVQAVFYQRCAQIAWRELGLRFLITGAESNVTCHHLMGRQVAEAAKLHGVHTIQMQHGVWIEQFPQRLIEFGSETIWSWGESYERFIHESRVSLAGKTVQGCVLPWQRFRAVGGPKFIDMRLSPPQDLFRWRLGLDTSRYRGVALLGTNLLWHRHGTAAQTARARLVKMMQALPDLLFIVKLHPSERAPGAGELALANSVVLDDVLMGMLDLHVTRLVAAVDVVISSLSTLLLDAAVAGKPCVQYDTGNDLSYAGMASVEIEQLPQLLTDIAAIPVNVELVQEYASAAVEPFYEHLARTLAAPTPSYASRTQIEGDAASYYSAATETENLWCQVRDYWSLDQGRKLEIQRLHGEVNVLSTDNTRLAEELDAARTDAARALQQAQAAERTKAGELAALQRSKSWRLTAPLRGVRRLLGSIGAD
ncbi:hypothetical protein VLK31_24005 [Variovorax sp. H27-G14]|uniref:hypothetical protein n=1 Tax=Variovorax sp. H27-G14 TaxID=3111914 RepID=UPI0038FC276F